MNKTLAFLPAVAIGVLMSSQVFAAPITMTTSGLIKTVNCAALANDVSIQLSQGVVAAYECTPLSLKAATCHTKGSNKEQTHNCIYTQDQDEDGVPLAPESWTASAPGVCPAYSDTLTEEQKKVTFTGPLAYGGKSGGGSVGPRQLLEKKCDDSTIGTAVNDMN
ncbi:MAG: hypothetical protein M0R77_16020 [Gammaproteobacteria bacterium]|nr:hypothetical protein [Gammaproteobacteria bacterium]